MNKKNNFAKTFLPAIEKVTCKIYAVFCIALVLKYKFKPEECEELCELSQALWMEASDKNVDIFKWCYDVTGIDMSNRMHEK